MLIINLPGRTREQIGSDVTANLADMGSVGIMALSNPDLVKCLKTDAPFNDVRLHLFYAGGAEGCVDEPEKHAVFV